VTNKKMHKQRSITIYEPRLLQMLFNLLLIINYRFIINKLLQLT